jgi:hypothetical protein
VGEVAEAQRRLDVPVARCGDTRDRDGHVGAQHEHVSVLVEEPVRRLRAGEVRALDLRLELQRGRVDLAVARLVEHRAHAVGDGAQLPHLVGQHVSRSAGDRVGHGVEDEVCRDASTP